MSAARRYTSLAVAIGTSPHSSRFPPPNTEPPTLEPYAVEIEIAAVPVVAVSAGAGGEASETPPPTAIFAA